MNPTDSPRRHRALLAAFALLLTASGAACAQQPAPSGAQSAPAASAPSQTSRQRSVVRQRAPSISTGVRTLA